jgi:cyclopropane fatty-acyl-phospholipid synthase-like methyltransferase
LQNANFSRAEPTPRPTLHLPGPRNWSRDARKPLAILLLLAVTSGLGCTWIKRCAYQGFGRDTWQQPERVVETLAISPGDRVADLGAGGGYFSFLLAEAVGGAGRLFAVDVDPGMNDYVAKQARRRELPQITTVLAAADDPRLPEPVDLLFTSNTFHHLDDRVSYFRKVRENYLRPGARVAIIDYLPEVTDHATEPELILQEMEAAGFALEIIYAWLERQSFLVFRVAED